MDSNTAPKLFYLSKENGPPALPNRLAVEHMHTIKSEAYAVGYLSRRIYGFNLESTLFTTHIFPTEVNARFVQVLQDLTAEDVHQRITVSEAVKVLSGLIWNLPCSSDYFYFSSTT